MAGPALLPGGLTIAAILDWTEKRSVAVYIVQSSLHLQLGQVIGKYKASTSTFDETTSILRIISLAYVCGALRKGGGGGQCSSQFWAA